MEKRQLDFCLYFCGEANGNRTKAAEMAGYSARSAYNIGSRLMKKDEIKEKIKELQKIDETDGIATIAEIKRTWTQIMNDETAKNSDRLRASENLAKSYRIFDEF